MKAPKTYKMLPIDFMRKERMSNSSNRKRRGTPTENLTDEEKDSKRRWDSEMGEPASAKKLLVFVFFLLAFMVICALVFSHLESANEDEQLRYWKAVKEDVTKQYNLSDKELTELLLRLHGVKKYGLSSKNKWDFYNSFWFTMTITTTIGFGHITPLTTGGRIFCIFCGILGIPLNALVLKHVGNKIRIWITSIICAFEVRWLGRAKCHHAGVKCACVTFFLMILFIMLGGSLDLMFDGWTFADGIYFNFIALSTVGFGDIYPSVENPSKLDDIGLNAAEKRFLASGILLVYLTLGLAIVSTVVVSILNAMDEAEKAKRKIVRWKRNGIKLAKGQVEGREAKREFGVESGNLQTDYGIANGMLSLEEKDGKNYATRF